MRMVGDLQLGKSRQAAALVGGLSIFSALLREPATTALSSSASFTGCMHNASSFIWTGVFPAITTQMQRDGRLDLDATARHAEAHKKECAAPGKDFVFFFRIHLRTIPLHLLFRPPRLVGRVNQSRQGGLFVSGRQPGNEFHQAILVTSVTTHTS